MLIDALVLRSGELWKNDDDDDADEWQREREVCAGTTNRDPQLCKRHTDGMHSPWQSGIEENWSVLTATTNRKLIRLQAKQLRIYLFSAIFLWPIICSFFPTENCKRHNHVSHAFSSVSVVIPRFYTSQLVRHCLNTHQAHIKHTLSWLDVCTWWMFDEYLSKQLDQCLTLPFASARQISSIHALPYVCLINA